MKKQAAMEKRASAQEFVARTKNMLLDQYKGAEVNDEMIGEMRKEMISLVKEAHFDDVVTDIKIKINGTTAIHMTAVMREPKWDEEGA
jgi:hypothetical protein